MRPGGSKQKGAAFEREICRRLSLAVTQDKRKDLFWRSAMSGGRATLMHRKDETNQTQAGDISALDSAGEFLTNQFVFECKHVKNLGLQQWLVHGTGPVARYLAEVLKIGDKVGRRVVLIARQNHIPDLVFTDAVQVNGPPIAFEHLKRVHQAGALMEPHTFFKLLTGQSIYLYHFNEFLAYVRKVSLPPKITRERL